jgi:hypothetical protein
LILIGDRYLPEFVTTYFGEHFGPRTLRDVPSDALRRTLLVERMGAEIRAGQKPLTPLWNWVAADPRGSHKPNRSHRKEGISLSINGFWPNGVPAFGATFPAR